MSACVQCLVILSLCYCLNLTMNSQNAAVAQVQPAKFVPNRRQVTNASDKSSVL